MATTIGPRDHPHSPNQSYGAAPSGLSKNQLIGAGVVLSIHIVFFWALQSGVAQKSFETIKKTVEAKIILEPKVEVRPEPPKLAPKVEVKAAKAEPKPEPKSEPKIVPPKLDKPLEPPKVAPPIVEAPVVIAAVPSPAPSPVSVPLPAAATVPTPTPTPAATPTVIASPAQPKAAPKTGATLAKGTCEEPDYPPISLRAKEEGAVLLEFTVSPEGKVVQSKVLSSSGFPRLDEAARNAFSKCKFSPATTDGQAVQGSTRFRYNWTLTE
jgi:periplasmic protein TonB